MANYDVNYNDKRLVEVTDEEKAQLSQTETEYKDLANSYDTTYKEWSDKLGEQYKTQEKNANERLEFDIKKIEQQREQSKQDYTKEQSGAYADWQKESNRYGVNAERIAEMGLSNSGYSESSQVRMYTAYQNRVATAREAFTRVNMNYDNMIQEAKLQNNALLAEIALETFQKQMELALEGFNYKNQLLLELSNKKLEIKQMYHSKYQDVLKQINTELAFEYQQEQDRLANERADAALKLQQDQFAWQKEQANKAATITKSSSGGSSAGKKSSASTVAEKYSKGIQTTVTGAFAGTTYEKATEYMESRGASDEAIDGLMTSTEWTRRKTSYRAGNNKKAEVANYNSYAEYLQAYTAWAVSNK